MLFSVPVFSVTNYLDDPDSYTYGISLIKALGPETLGGQLVFLDTMTL